MGWKESKKDEVVLEKALQTTDKHHAWSQTEYDVNDRRPIVSERESRRPADYRDDAFASIKFS